MPKKTTILIVILAIVTGLLIYLAIRSDQASEIFTNKPADITITPTPIVVVPYVNFSFATPTLDLSSTQTLQQSVDIVIDTQGKNVATAQIELQYDPKVISNLTFTQPASAPAFFGTNQLELINSVDPTQGRATYATATSLQDSEKTGSGIVTTMKFTVTKTPGIPSTRIEFLPKSAATTLTTRESVLNTVTPLTIILSN